MEPLGPSSEGMSSVSLVRTGHPCGKLTTCLLAKSVPEPWLLLGISKTTSHGRADI